MSLQDLNLKTSYDSSVDDIISEFYVPVLSNASNYDRIAGFFTSSSLAISSKGILNIAENGGHIRLLVSPKLNNDDVELINNAILDPETHINNVLFRELVDSKIDIIENYKLLLAHLIAKQIIEIKIVLIKKDNKFLSAEEIDKSSIFHQKIGIIYDNNGDCMSFSGSINESFSAWNDNVEEFKTFRSWDDGQKDYCYADIDKFNSFWSGNRDKVSVMDLPAALKSRFIEMANSSDFKDIKNRIKYRETNNFNKKLYNTLFWYQKEAVNKWKDNDYKMLFAMATGTGKTRTAIACLSELIKNYKILTVIATPQSSLSRQWFDEIIKLKIPLDRTIICDSSNTYKNLLNENISKLNLGVINNLTLFTTHSTASSQDFIASIHKVNHHKVKTLFIGDEVHGLGSSKQRDALLEEYDYRIGLSATPARWFDDAGSILLEKYFGNNKFEFGIDKALVEINPLTGKSFLTPYNYVPEFVTLTDDEDYKYEYYTNKITRCQGDDEEIEKSRERLLQKRAEIIKNAENKIDKLKEILIDRSKRGRIENTIIFTSPHHLKSVMNVLYELNIIASPFTEKQGTKIKPEFGGKSERQMIIDQFKNKNIQVIVAIKCMDEGIDVPSADTAILMSSTTNPREYIQRIGRVIRRYSGKKYAEIIDLIVRSDDDIINKTIQQNEYKRVKYIVKLAHNSVYAINKIFD